jgi:hypothetical protein
MLQLIQQFQNRILVFLLVCRELGTFRFLICVYVLGLVQILIFYLNLEKMFLLSEIWGFHLCSLVVAVVFKKNIY